MNGFNEGDCEKNGEFKALLAFAEFYDVFIDVGSNNGIFIDKLNSALVESKNRDAFFSPFYVMAFEPNPKLKATIESKIIRGELLQIALSNKEDRVNFNIYSADDTVSSLFPRSDMMPHFTSNVANIEVKAAPLDNYLLPIEKEAKKGVFLKIDAEGGDFLVLDGSQKLFASLSRIFIMFEYSKAWKIGGFTLKDAFHLLDRGGFSIFRVTPLGLEHLRFYTPDMDGFDYCNYFAVKGFSLRENFQVKSIRSTTHNRNDFFLFPR